MGGVGSGYAPALQDLATRDSQLRDAPQSPRLIGLVGVVSPLAVVPPASAVRVFQRAINFTALAITANQIIPALSVAWGAGTAFALRRYEVTVNAPTVAMDLFFTLLFNGGPLAGLERIRTPSSAAVVEKWSSEPWLSLPPNGRLTASVSNQSALAFNVNVAVEGWTYTFMEAQDLAGGNSYLLGMGG